MGGKIGEVDYDEQAALKLGASYPPNEAAKTELSLIDSADGADSSEDAEDFETVHWEAKAIAGEIRKLVSSPFKVYDGKTKTHRNIQYRDIVIFFALHAVGAAINGRAEKPGHSGLRQFDVGLL